MELLARGLLQRGHRVTGVFRTGAPSVERFADLGIEILELPFKSDLDAASATTLVRRARDLNADLMHAGEARSHAVAALARRFGLRLPLVVSRRILRRPRSRSKYRRADLYLAISDRVASSLATAVHPGRIRVVRSGIPTPSEDEPSADLKSAGFTPEKPTVVTATALSPEKDIGTLISAAVLGRQRRLDLQWLLLGDGQLRNRVEGRVAQTHIPLKVMGHVSDVGPWLRAATVMAHPAPDEALGTSVLEGLARGLPVVGAKGSGLADYVTDQVGRLVRPRDPEELLETVARCVTDSHLKGTASVKGPEIAARYSVHSMVLATEAVYRGLLAGAEAKN